jgi:hypothetical protein
VSQRTRATTGSWIGRSSLRRGPLARSRSRRLGGRAPGTSPRDGASPLGVHMAAVVGLRLRGFTPTRETTTSWTGSSKSRMVATKEYTYQTERRQTERRTSTTRMPRPRKWARRFKSRSVDRERDTLAHKKAHEKFKATTTAGFKSPQEPGKNCPDIVAILVYESNTDDFFLLLPLFPRTVRGD